MASGIKNTNRAYKYQGSGEDWPEDSYWTIRTERTRDDIDTITGMLTQTVLSGINRDEVRKIMKGTSDPGVTLEDYVRDHSETVTLMSEQTAALATLGVKVEGELFTVPEDYTDESGNAHPMAGKLIPQPPALSLKYTGKESDRRQYDRQLQAHLYWLKKLDAEITQDVYGFFQAVWIGGDPERIKSFQGGGSSVDGPVPEKRATSRARVSG